MADTLTLNIKLDGKDHVFRYDDCTAVDYSDCRRQTGIALTRLLGMIEDGDTDIDSIAAAVWLARRQAGERKLSYEQVASKIHPTTPCEIEVVTSPNGQTAEEMARNAAEETADPE